MELHLYLDSDIFELVQKGVKKEINNPINGYWINKLINIENEPTWDINDFIREFFYHGNELNFIEKYGKNFDKIILKNRYEKIEVEYKGIEIRKGYFVIKLGEILV